VRHVAFAAATRIEDRPDFLLPLYFAIVGCLPLPVNRGVGVLVIPDVEDLHTFARDRPAMTPTSARDCRIAGTSDAVLQAVTRLRGRGYVEAGFLPGCVGARFQPTSWASQQKSRIDTVQMTLEEVVRYEPDEKSSECAGSISSRWPSPCCLHGSCRGPSPYQRAVGVRPVPWERTESYWIDSIVRPLVADNLASGRRWYDGFTRLGEIRILTPRSATNGKGYKTWPKPQASLTTTS